MNFHSPKGPHSSDFQWGKFGKKSFGLHLPFRRPEASARALRNGFTLTELLVAITIVILLIALAIPTYQAVMMASMKAASTSNLKQITQATLTYVADNDCYPPASDQANLRRWHGARKSIKSPFLPEDGFLADYLGKSRQVTPCPLLKQMLQANGQTFEDGSGGYGYNATYLGGMRDYEVDSDKVYVPARAAKILNPSRTVMFGTTAYARADGVQEYPFCEPPFWDFGNGPSGSRPSPSLHFRFNGIAIVSWCDGHISYEKKVERGVGGNPNGGDASKQNLGWFGPDENNGYWNPNFAGP